ncbi:MAG TPA: two-component regulator propeller domain-containing protein, partial [Chitinophagaceae bacterium]|nr:two-component regulator propeller domain-containing protein [Chitinophagaceae bacterium]
MKYTAYILLLVVASMLIGFFSNAQQFIFKTYNVEDGLVSNPVRRIFQDRKGFIWIATGEGLSKYDGDKFTNYTTANGLSHNMVNDIYESPEGKLYIAENNGIVDVLQYNAIVKKAAFRNVIINQFHVTQNQRLLAATDTGGVQEIKNETLVKPFRQLPGASYNDLTEISDSIFVGGLKGPLNILNRNFEIISTVKLPEELVTFKIYKDSKNKIWVGTNVGLKILSPLKKNDHLPQYALLPASFNIRLLKDDIINDIMEDTEGNLWIASSHGLVKIDPNGDGRVFLEKDGLPTSNIACIYQDSENNIWIGSALGLTKLVTKNNIRIYTDDNKLASGGGVSYLLPLKPDQFLIGTETGPQLFNTSNSKFLSVKAQNDIFYTGFVKNSRPLLFYGNQNRFGKYNPVSSGIEDFILPAPPESVVYCSLMDTNGIIFNGTAEGLVIRSENKSYYYKNLPCRITDMLIDKMGYLWVATWDNGLFRIHYSNIKDEVNITIKDFSSSLPERNLRCLYEDSRGNIWIGMRYKGLIELKYNSPEQYTVQHFNLQSGLMSNWTRAIAEGLNGSIWIGSDLGIDKLIPSAASYRVFNFSRMANYFTQINAISAGNDHSLWLTSTNGFTNIIDGETEKTLPAPVYITSVGLGDTNFNYHTHQINTNVNLKYFQNQAKFEFSAPAFINEKQILYSYRLAGSADTTWSKPTNLHTVSYASLQPGNYRFEVRTIGWNGEWGASASFVFIISPPYWQTWWFYVLVGLLVLLLLYAFYHYRIRQLLKLQKVRDRIATDLHDDIGSALTNINMLSEISRKNLGQPKEASFFLQRITEEVSASSQALN